jgi:hypothetical protein
MDELLPAPVAGAQGQDISFHGDYFAQGENPLLVARCRLNACFGFRVPDSCFLDPFSLYFAPCTFYLVPFISILGPVFFHLAPTGATFQ